MNRLFFWIMLVAFASAAWRQYHFIGTEISAAPMQMLSTAMLASSTQAVTLALSLVGTTAFFLGLLKIAETGGLLKIAAKLLRPLLCKLFPDIPPNHPALGAIVMNLSANTLGLGNAATPFGLRAMQALETLNPHKGKATDAMILFLAINTSSVTLLPTGVIALRTALGSHNPAGIVATTLCATLCSTTVAIIAAKLYARRAKATENQTLPLSSSQETATAPQDSYPLWVSLMAFACVLSLIPLSLVYANVFSIWLIPSLAIGFLVFGWYKKVPLYEEFIEGAKEGFQMALRIIPYLVAILVAIGMLRESGALALLVSTLTPLTTAIGLPAEVLPMALLRPMSGSGSYGLLAATLSVPATGPDTYIGYLLSTMQGSTETTFYVLALYFGAANIKQLRYALLPALSADTMGVFASVIVVSYLFSDSQDAHLMLTRGLPLFIIIFALFYWKNKNRTLPL